MLLRHLIPALLLISGLLSTEAQQPRQSSVSANVLTNRVARGEIGQFIVKITNGEAEMPQQIPAEGLIIEKSGSQSSIAIINGNQTLEMTYFYRFQGSEIGEFRIPELEINVSGNPMKTPAITITIF